MLDDRQQRFRDTFLSPLKQKLYFAKNLPMGFISGIRLTRLDEDRSVSTVKFHWWNKNPFRSIYFAVLSMAAELSTAGPAMLAMKHSDASIAMIIVEVRAEFVKKAQTTITFSCTDYPLFHDAIRTLEKADDTATVTARTVATDEHDETIATFDFTWSFRRRA